MRWFNWVGMGMLAFGVVLNEWVYASIFEKFNIFVLIGAVTYLIVGIWLSMWEGNSPDAEYS